MDEILPPPAAHAVESQVTRQPSLPDASLFLFTIKVFSSEPQKGQLPLIVPFLDPPGSLTTPRGSP